MCPIYPTEAYKNPQNVPYNKKKFVILHLNKPTKKTNER